ncbi:MAG: hypothetical protein PHP45_08450 [Elusimicrobiales bacterium]|nr:hypothetical protein [Elusimicrobiales bacterium]
MNEIYIFKFGKRAATELLEAQITLAVIAVECMLGKAAVRIGFRYAVKKDKNAVVMETGNEAGEAIVRVFTGLLIRAFGETRFKVEHTRREPRHD